MTKTRLLILICLTFFIALPLGAKAFFKETGNSVYIPKEQTVDTNLFAAGNIINVDGHVQGDVICAGQMININGKVDGDVICAGQTVNVNGEVGGSVRVAGNSVSINGKVARNIYMAGAALAFGQEAEAGWDAFIAGASADIRGKINGDLLGAGANTIISGTIGKNVRLYLDEKVKSASGTSGTQDRQLVIAKGAVISGNVTYLAGNDAQVDPGATIKGKLEKMAPKAINGKAKASAMGMGAAISVFGALVVGMVLVSVWRKPVRELTDLMLEKPGAAIGFGAAIMFLTPIAAIILMITLIGLPLAMILIAAWFIALYIAKIIVAILIGRSLLEKLWQKKSESLIWAMISGVIIVWLICALPLLGWLLGLIAIWWGMGGAWLYFTKK